MSLLTRKLSRKQSRASSRGRSYQSSRHEEEDADEGDDEEEDEQVEMEQLLGQIFGSAGSEDQQHVKENVGVSFENLTTYGKGIGASYFVSPGILLGKLFHREPKAKSPALSRTVDDADGEDKKTKKKRKPTRKLIDGFSGVVQPGEMCLVLGRPGSGCTTFLRTISGYDEGFEKVEGDVRFGNFGMKEMKRFYRGEVAFNEEKDIHLATLTVKQTLEFAVSCRTPRANQRQPGQSRKQFISTFLEVLGQVFGLARVFDTKVGNDLIRGVSGGEKKGRVSPRS